MKEKVIYSRGEIRLGLERMYELMDRVGNPNIKLPVIQIAGTNGKGSCGELIRSILQNAGLRVGHYQTPAVFDPMEIISVNKQNISEEAFTKYKLAIEKCYENEASDDKPTKFEIDTAIAYMYLCDMNCDVAIMEAGMGGDTDATNVAENTIASVISSVGMDHMEYLGQTTIEIAAHKAGIIKKGAVCISPEQEKGVAEVLIDAANTVGTDIIFASRAQTASNGKLSYRIYSELECGLKGSFQQINVATAITTVCELKRRWQPLKNISDKIFDRAVREGCKQAGLFGRFSLIGEAPRMLIDGAHNPPAAIRLSDALKDGYGDSKRIYITGVFSDKDYLNVIKTVAQDCLAIYTVTAPGKRGLSSEVLAAEINDSLGIKAVSAVSLEKAVELACEQAVDMKGELGYEPLIVAFGSFSWLAEVKEEYDNWKQKNR